MNRIGLFGGSFNPIHLGHMIMAQDALEECNLDKVFFIPCLQHSLKDPSAYVKPEHRLAMVELAISGNSKKFVSSDMEITTSEISHTITTARAFRRMYPADEIHIIVGLDAFCDILSWMNPDELLTDYKWIVLWRDEADAGLKRLHERAPLFLSKEGHKGFLLARVLRLHDIRISSTDIRNRIRAGKSIRYLADELVREYIEHHDLYKPL